VVTIRIPVPSSTVVSNLLGVAGLLAVVFAIAALTSWKWGLLAAGILGVALAVLAQYQVREPAGAATDLNDVRRGRAGRAA
jgi:uncharacterized membrane protein HdeD (DUF308 family)